MYFPFITQHDVKYANFELLTEEQIKVLGLE